MTLFLFIVLSDQGSLNQTGWGKIYITIIFTSADPILPKLDMNAVSPTD